MSKRKKLFVALATVAVLVVGGIAYAAWTADGSGSGSAKAKTAAVITLTASATPTAELYPGSTGGNIYFAATNTNPYDVTFTGFTAGTITSSDPTGCPATNVTVDDSGALTLGVAAGATDVDKEIDGVVSMSHDAPDGCQGVTFTIPLTLTGAQD